MADDRDRNTAEDIGRPADEDVMGTADDLEDLDDEELDDEELDEEDEEE